MSFDVTLTHRINLSAVIIDIEETSCVSVNIDMEEIKCPDVYVIPSPETDEEAASRCRCDWIKIIGAGVVSMIGGIIGSNPLTLTASGVAHAVLGSFVGGVGNSGSTKYTPQVLPTDRELAIEKSTAASSKYISQVDPIIRKQNEIIENQYDKLMDLAARVKALETKKVRKKKH